MPGSKTEDSESSDQADIRPAGQDLAFARLSEALTHLVPHLRSLTRFLTPDGQPADDLIARFLESLGNRTAEARVSAAGLEARFFDFMDEDNQNSLHAIYLRMDVGTKLIGHMPLGELRRLLEVTPAVYSSDTGQ